MTTSGGMPRLPRAACRTPERQQLFMNPESHNTTACKAICFSCPEQRDCLLWGVLHEAGWGVWGGFTGPELSALRRQYGIQLDELRAGYTAKRKTTTTTRSTL